MPSDVTVYHNWVTEATERLNKVRRSFPDFMRESEVIQMFTTAWGEEITSRIADVNLTILRNVRPSTAEQIGFAWWEELLNLEHNVGDSDNLIRARILSKTVKKERSRVVDIATIVRFFLVGTKTFTTLPIENNTRIPVGTITGFSVGTTVYIGSLARSIVSIDVANSTLIVSSPIVKAHAFTIVSQHEITIEEQYSTYFFKIYLDIGLILNQQSLINAILAARPAHLGFSILSGDLDYEEAATQYEEGGAQYNAFGQIFTT